MENESVIEERFQASISQNALLGVWSIVLGGFPSFSLSHSEIRMPLFQMLGGVVFHSSSEGLDYDFRYGVTNGFTVRLFTKSSERLPKLQPILFFL